MKSIKKMPWTGDGLIRLRSSLICFKGRKTETSKILKTHKGV